MCPAPTTGCVKRLQRELMAIIKEENQAASAAGATSEAAGAAGSAASHDDSNANSKDSDSRSAGTEGRAKKDPPASHAGKSAFVTARPDPKNILNWYFLINGPEATPYAGGRYIGTLRFPGDYPFKPPTIMILTPNGRFQTNTAICMSNSSFHPEQWSPIWNVQTIVLGFVSFMVENIPGLGSLKTTTAERRRLAKESRKFNVESLTHVYASILPNEYKKDVAYLASPPPDQSDQPERPPPALCSTEEVRRKDGSRKSHTTRRLEK